MGTLILENVIISYQYKMAMHVRTEGDIYRFSLRQNFRLLLTLFESKPHIIIIFHLKT